MITLEFCICSECDIEHGYSSSIYEKLNKISKEYGVDHFYDLPGNHPMWRKFDLEMKPHQVNCAVFEETALCIMHLEDALIKLKEKQSCQLSLQSEEINTE